MSQLETLAESLPEWAKDLRINLTNVFKSENLSSDQIWGVALSSSQYLRDRGLREAVIADATEAGVSEAVFDDARAAASLMGMNTVFYRFRHMIGKESYGQLPARLRMMRMKAVKTSARDFELFSLAVAALAGCEMCIKAHEASILREGLGEEHVNEVVRIAATLSGVAVARAD